jgi:prepilin-type N-terminal cleavage/methylation domain-containing protein
MRFRKTQSGFTLMEILVSTTIFATSVVLMLSLFNYTLKDKPPCPSIAPSSARDTQLYRNIDQTNSERHN